MGSRRWIFRICSLVLGPLLVFGSIEAVLRLSGYGYPTHFFISREINGRQVHTDNEKFGWRFFGRTLARTPKPTVLPQVKPAGSCRIFVFGESAAYGDPRPDFGLPRVLEALLREAYPGVQIDVINVSMTAINSHVILPIARDCAGQQGDLWVIYMGNNEVVGPFGSGTVFGPQAPGLGVVRGSIALKSTRLGQGLAALVDRGRTHDAEPSEWEGMQMFLGSRIRQEDSRMPRVYSHFSRNLADILQLAQARGVKVVLTTVAANLRDCAPFGSEHRPGLTPEQTNRWNKVYYEGVAEEVGGNAAKAIERYEEAAKIDDQFADLQYRWGRCSLLLGQDEPARSHFSLARDYDTLRFRADSRINDLIRQSAASRENRGVLLADAERDLAVQSPHGLAGEELFYEHVHLTFEGNYLLARCIAEQAAKLLPELLAKPAGAKPVWPSAAECARRLAWNDVDRCNTLKSVLQRLNNAPFTFQLNHAEARNRLQARIEALLPALQPAGLREAAGLYRRALERAPEDWVLQRNFADLLVRLGDYQGAELACRKVAELIPHDPLAHLELGLILLRNGRAQEALEQCDIGLRLAPDSVPLLNGRALALTGLGKPEPAIAQYEESLKRQPQASETHLNLAIALESRGRKESAREHYLRALAHPKDTPEGRIRMGKICMTQGWPEAAITNLARAVALDPTDASARFYLGSALGSGKKDAEAATHLSEAVRLNPGFAPARLGLGVVLLRQGKDAESVEQFNAALRLDAGLTEARLDLGMALLHQGKTSEARRQFEEILAREPGNTAAQKYISTLPP